MGIALLTTLALHLLPALLAGLLVFELVHMLAPRLKVFRVSQERGKILIVALITVIVVTVLTLLVIGMIAFFRSEAGSLMALMEKMADVIEGARAKMPEWISESIPANAEDLRITIVDWLRAHAGELQTVGKEAGRGIAHFLIGIIIGAFISLRKAVNIENRRPLARAMTERVDRLGNAFRRIVFAQVRISALNTTLTAIYLAIVLPMFGIHLPLTKTMIAVTFLVGLMPVIGNLISNTVIVIVSLSYSLGVAIASLAFLVIIHKLEYFVNARIIGTQIRAGAWELLLAMLVMESAFGISGVVAAPIYYGYIKDELTQRGLI